jgi:sugar phosphate isomerase/epimerase
MTNPLTRRDVLTSGVAAGAALSLGTSTAAADQPRPPAGFRYCFNTATIRGQKLPIDQVAAIAARAGYDAIEPWIDELDQYVKDGKSLKDLGKLIADLGLTVESAIGFAEWIVGDPERRARGLEEAKRTMGLVANIGGLRIAAPPSGATDARIEPADIGPRYRTLLEIGDNIGVVPQLELWGFSKTLGRLSEVMLAAIESRHPRACVLPDVFHLYKGGSDFSGVRIPSCQALHVFHMNDYPAAPPREQITDAARIYPGDGVAPLASLSDQLRGSGFSGVLSLEMFNRDYWQQDAALVARIGLEKMKAAVATSAK